MKGLKGKAYKRLIQAERERLLPSHVIPRRGRRVGVCQERNHLGDRIGEPCHLQPGGNPSGRVRAALREAEKPRM